MGDIALVWSQTAGSFDLVIEDNDLATDDGLRTAVVLSLFTDGRAEAGDTLPDSEPNRRGWWADAVPVVEGDRFGCRRWLLARSKETPDVLAREVAYDKEALQWLLDDSIASAVEVTAEFLQPLHGVVPTVTLRRPKQDAAKFRFDQVWSAEESRI